MKKYEEIYKNSLLFELQEKWGIEGEITFTQNTLSFNHRFYQIFSASHFGLSRVIQKELDVCANLLDELLKNIEKTIENLENKYPSHIQRTDLNKIKIGNIEIIFSISLYQCKNGSLEAKMTVKEEGYMDGENEIRLLTHYQYFLEALEETLIELVCVNAIRDIFEKESGDTVYWYSDEECLLLATKNNTMQIRHKKEEKEQIHVQVTLKGAKIVDKIDTLENILKPLEEAMTVQAKKERLSNLFSR